MNKSMLLDNIGMYETDARVMWLLLYYIDAHFYDHDDIINQRVSWRRAKE